MKNIAAYGLCAFTISSLLTMLMIRINIKDIPGIRSSHHVTTPRCGGIGVIGGFLISIGIAYKFGTLEGGLDKGLFILFSGALLTGLIGFMDDLKSLSWKTRFLSQLIIAGSVVLSGFSFNTFPLPYFGSIELGILGPLITIFWIIGMVNAFNFMDGINGLSGGMTLTACFFLMLLIQKDSVLLFSLGILAFSTFGFWIFNFPKGKIFLGDVGSQFLGFFFACLGVLLPLEEPHFSPLIVPILFFIYVFDTVFTILRRLYQSQNIFSAHCQHLYQLLVRSGLSHASVTGLYLIFFILQGTLSLMMRERSFEFHLYPFIFLALFYSLFAIGTLVYTRKRGVKVLS